MPAPFPGKPKPMPVPEAWRDELPGVETVDLIPLVESLGRVLLETGRNNEAEAAFRAELARRPRGGRALFGLAESLRRQGKTRAAELVDLEFKAAWKNAEKVELRVEDL